MNNRFFNPKTVYAHKKSGVQSSNVEDVLMSDVINLNTNVPKQSTYPKKGADLNFAFFKDLDVLSVKAYNSTELLNMKSHTAEIKYVHFMDKVLSTMANVIKSEWDPNKMNVVLHSSGHDSRVFSGLMSRIVKEHGYSWIGNLVFACFGSECQSSRDSLEYGGWDKYPFLAIHEIKSRRYYKQNFEFKEAWKRAGGVCLRPPNNTFRLIEREVVDNFGQDHEIVLWANFFSNELFDCVIPFCSRYGKHPLKYLVNRWRKSRFFQDICNIDLHCPLLHESVLKVIIQSKIDHNFKIRKDALRKHVLLRLDPRLKSNFQNTGTHKNTSIMDPATVQRCRMSYEKSWYCQNSNRKGLRSGPGSFNDSYWWANYNLASLLRHFIENGHEINLKG